MFSSSAEARGYVSFFLSIKFCPSLSSATRLAKVCTEYSQFIPNFTIIFSRYDLHPVHKWSFSRNFSPFLLSSSLLPFYSSFSMLPDYISGFTMTFKTKERKGTKKLNRRWFKIIEIIIIISSFFSDRVNTNYSYYASSRVFQVQFKSHFNSR